MMAITLKEPTREQFLAIFANLWDSSQKMGKVISLEMTDEVRPVGPGRYGTPMDYEWTGRRDVHVVSSPR
jgi:hypothetical protein